MADIFIPSRHEYVSSSYNPENNATQPYKEKNIKFYVFITANELKVKQNSYDFGLHEIHYNLRIKTASNRNLQVQITETKNRNGY